MYNVHFFVVVVVALNFNYFGVLYESLVKCWPCRFIDNYVARMKWKKHTQTHTHCKLYIDADEKCIIKYILGVLIQSWYDIAHHHNTHMWKKMIQQKVKYQPKPNGWIQTRGKKNNSKWEHKTLHVVNFRYNYLHKRLMPVCSFTTHASRSLSFLFKINEPKCRATAKLNEWFYVDKKSIYLIYIM